MAVAAARCVVAAAAAMGPTRGRVRLRSPTEVMVSNVEAANAMSPTMMLDFADVVTELEGYAEDAQGLVDPLIIRGDPKGRVFCAGADVKACAPLLADADGRMAMATLMHDTLSRLHALPLLVVAAIDGGAFGGGAELATAADVRVLAADARIVFVHATRGMSPGWGGAARLKRLLPPEAAMRLILTATPITPDSPWAPWLVDCVAQADDASPTPALWPIGD
ncbi:enoyl Coenzyme A hydratase domain containing 1 [Thecamonas trahens ATCC 50062]|uniref:Ethylmalonyl-CoA decarboxylase n=1 Tax=Thecamonas trahens ATCC 50062 TaxID=461836 RepID=A0A0L0DR20_THETB|nr:enoyl Coenzyme A hydratase domain containing 1 [Thecamonas trahens ATCC 50062]KNC53883.1 enoyl Coenzyme A hydratase domain containing 1 [Thecamonas trahens ATCC 50062]|eukprot:XP_013754259.1 enoyl Coenzyme A hydratase domain containing 1 [Thecamonas trahens ATCC 50062]